MRGRSVMRNGLALLLLAAAVAAGAVAAQSPEGAEPQAVLANMGTAFTYQGQLVDAGAPAAGLYDFQFRLYDAAAGGVQIGSTQTVSDVAVSGGLFTTPLDFGADAFNGQARWLEIDVKRDADAGYTTLSPRVALSPTPNALALPGLWTQQNATSPNLIGGYAGNVISPGVQGGVIGGGGGSSSPNQVFDIYGVVGGGDFNAVGTDDGDPYGQFHATVGGGQYNTAGERYSTVGGGYYNRAGGYFSTVSGGFANSASAQGSTAGGGWNNEAAAFYATIAGGGPSDSSNPSATNNRVHDNYGSIGGGGGNVVGSDDGDATNQTYGTVAGGMDNTASGAYATVSGGHGAAATHYGEEAHASGYFANAGDAQAGQYVLRQLTIGASPRELFLDGSTHRITLAAGRVMTFDILVVASDQLSGSSAGYRVTGVIRNIGSTTSFVGTPVKTILGENLTDWDVVVEANNSLDALVIRAQGSTSTTVRWVATVRTVEVSW